MYRVNGVPIVHADEFPKIPPPKHTFCRGESLAMTPKNTPATALSSRRLCWKSFFFSLFSLRPIHLKTRIPLALGVLFSEAMFEGGFWEVLHFATWNIFPFYEEKSFEEKTQKPCQGRHRQSNRTWKSPSQPKKAGRETLPLVFLQVEHYFVQRNLERYSWFCLKSSWYWPSTSCNLPDFKAGEQKKTVERLFSR